MAKDRPAANNLEGVLDEMCEARDSSPGPVSVDDILRVTGQRSFGVLLLVLSLMAFTPLGGIPGLPTALAIIVILLAGQLVAGINQFWLPGFVRHRSADPENVEKAVRILRPVARPVDRLLQPRLVVLTKEPFVRVAAVLCVLVALTVPPLELVPFAGTVSWAAIAAFALSLIAHDGLLMLVALGFTIGTGYMLATTLLI